MAKKKIAIKVRGGLARKGGKVSTDKEGTLVAIFNIVPEEKTDTDIEKILEQRVNETNKSKT